MAFTVLAWNYFSKVQMNFQGIVTYFGMCIQGAGFMWIQPVSGVLMEGI